MEFVKNKSFLEAKQELTHYMLSISVFNLFIFCILRLPVDYGPSPSSSSK